ncbi:MAG: LytTR family DNA-binding domain-containing protein [Sporolactobacillus sp.]
MLSIYLCEDNHKQLETYTQIIRNQILFFECDARIKEATDNPSKIISSIKKSKENSGLYILDIEFTGKKKNGLDLGVEVRSLDVNAKIIFITTHSEMSFLTFERKVEPFDYILKERGFEQIKKQLEEDLRIIWDRKNKGEQKPNALFSYRVGRHLRHIPMNELLFLETSSVPHRVTMHAINKRSEFIGNLADMQNEYPHLFRCHKSFLINPDNVLDVDREKRIVTFSGNLTCDISYRKIREIRKFFLR